MDSLKKNREFIIKYFNAISGVEKTRELCEEYTNDEKLIEHIQFFDGAFPKYELFVEEMVTEGNKVIVQGRATGIHEREFSGIPPTGRKMDLPFVIRYTIENGRITDHWLIADQMILMEQLGVMQPQTTAS
ncbi:ester cyclase [Maribacter halichondriae]|uniref:ester cyclase n=1 Tax=Maribacter halichondriae TaxID=2980554 RepID=UPI00235907D1|nr:ester cyclase [Maribacter sp. Hal144]